MSSIKNANPSHQQCRKMNYLAIFVMTLMGYLLLTALINLLMAQKIPRKMPIIHDLVSVLIPARDEEKNIGNLLSDLKQLSNDNLKLLLATINPPTALPK